MARTFSFAFNLTFFLFFILQNSVNCIKKYDCEVANEDLYLEKRSMVPRFGQSPTVIKFDSEEKVKQFIEDATKVYHEVMTGSNYNSLDVLLQLFADSKEAIAKDTNFLIPYIVKYQPKFRPRENGLSFAIEILNKISAMKDKYPEVENKGFLASSPTAFARAEISKMVLPSSADKIKATHNKKLINALATFKIEVNKKIVFVIFNAVYYLQKPVVLVQGFPADPLNCDTVEARTTTYKYRFFKEFSLDYILVDVHHNNKPKDFYCQELVYIGQSYCSFMDSTEKQYLVHPFKGIFKRGKGEELSGFHVDLETIAYGQPAVLYTTYYGKLGENNYTVNVQSLAIATNSSAPFDKGILDVQKKRLGLVAKALKYTYEELVKKLTALRDVLAHKQFVGTLTEIHQILSTHKPEGIDKFAEIVVEKDGKAEIAQNKIPADLKKAK